MNRGTETTTGTGGSDKLVLYASLFLYNPKMRMEYINYTPSIE
jgi:hypothetical protein